AHLQRPPHPLRLSLCDPGGRLPRPHRAWAADRDLAARPAPPRAAVGAGDGVLLPRQTAAVLAQSVPPARLARRRRPQRASHRCQSRRLGGDGGGGGARGMSGVLADLRIVESGAFVAAPSAGMTLAQLGADVIRIDPLAGGLDVHRWPVTKDGKSLYWAGL